MAFEWEAEDKKRRGRPCVEEREVGLGLTKEELMNREMSRNRLREEFG